MNIENWIDCHIRAFEFFSGDKRNMSEKNREEEILKAGATYLTSGDYSHLYYPKKFFEEFGSTNNLSVEIFDQQIKAMKTYSQNFSRKWIWL